MVKREEIYHMKPQYLKIRDELASSIVNGDYAVGEQLPSCRELAAKWQVSYMTISKAVNELAAENYVDLNHGRGVFVRWRDDGHFPTSRNVKILVPEGSHPYLDVFKNTAKEQLEQINWKYEFQIMQSVRELIAQVRDTSYYSLVYAFGLSKYEDIRDLCNAGRERLVMVGERYERFGISSSAVDNSQIIRLSMTELHASARKRIALLCTNLNHMDEAEYAAVWQNLFTHTNPGDSDYNELIWDLKLCPFSTPRESLYQLLQEKYEKGLFDKIDGIISTDDEKALILSNFCYDHKIEIPERLALVAINDSGMAELARPRLTSINIALPAQIANAVKILEEKVSGTFNGINLRLAEPVLIRRDSSSINQP